MKPEKKAIEYERVKIDEWIPGVIEEIEREKERNTGFKDEKTGAEKITDSVRLRFKLDGYNYPHRSRWMAFSYHEKSGLFKKYLFNLVEGAKPEMDFDLLALKGMRVKTMWGQNGDFQNLEMVRPETEKIPAGAQAPEAAEVDAAEEVVTDDSLPF